jgi:hypothetical protein
MDGNTNKLSDINKTPGKSFLFFLTALIFLSCSSSLCFLIERKKGKEMENAREFVIYPGSSSAGDRVHRAGRVPQLFC